MFGARLRTKHTSHPQPGAAGAKKEHLKALFLVANVSDHGLQSGKIVCMAVKTAFSQHEFSAILSRYSLGEYQGSSPISHGTVQTNFFLLTTQGKFVFRYYENRFIGSVLFESELIQYLKDQNYCCPGVLKNRSGEVVSIHNEKPYIIFEYVEGQHLENPNDAQKKQLIQKVAQLQTITRDYRPKHTHDRWNYDVERCRELALVAANRIGTFNSQVKLAWFEHELSQLQLPTSLPIGICHCDFHFSNILFKDGEFNALLDFDDANYTFLTYDLVTLMDPFIPSFNWNTWSDFKHDENVFDFSVARETVLEYNRHRLLDINEKQHLFDIYKLSILFDCIWYFERGAANDFYERRKIAYLDSLGRDAFFVEIFGKPC